MDEKIQDKNYGISLARGMACIFIVMVHAIPTLEVYTGKDMWRTWFAIGVPVFIIISGNLARKEKETSIISFIKKKCLRILLPYWIWIALAFVIYWLAGCEFSKENFFTMMFMGQNNGQYNPYVLPGFGQLWFVPFIMGCYCLVPVLHIVVQEILSNQRKYYAIYLGGGMLRRIYSHKVLEFYRADTISVVLCFVYCKLCFFSIF